MKKVISFIVCALTVFGTVNVFAGRVQLGMHKPEQTAAFSESFDGDLSAWNVEIANGAEWHISEQNGGKALTSGAVDTWNAEQETVIAVKKEISSDNYSVSMEATDKRYGAMASLVFKYESPQHFYSLRMLNIDDVDYIGFYRRNGVSLWQEEQLTLVEFPGGIRTPEVTFEIKVEVNGGNFKGYVDGTLLTEYTEDKAYFNGSRAGIFQSYGEPLYDNFKIYINDGAYDEEFLYNRRLLMNLGLWSGSTDKPEDLLSMIQLNAFMAGLCFAPAESTVAEYVSTEAAADSFMAAMGYDEIKSTSQYHNARSELMSGLSAAESITLKDFMHMAVNSFDINIVKQVYGSKEKYVIDENNTLLSLYHDVYFDEAVLSDNGITSLKGKSAVSKGEVSFDNGFEAKEGGTDASKYLGYTMKYYYRNTSEPYLIDIRIEEDELFLYSDEILSYNNGILSYCLRGGTKTEKVKLSDNANVIYNGVSVLNPTKDMFMPKSGSISVIGGADEDTVIITDYRDIVVDRVVPEESIIFDKLSDLPLSWDDAKRSEIYNSQYREMSADEIFEGDVISVAKSAKGEYITLTVSRSKVSGTVEKTDYTKNIAVIKGAEYTLSPDFFKSSYISPGDTGELYLNSNGIGVYFKQSTDVSYTVAYLIDMGQDVGTMDTRVWFYFFDGEVKKLPCASTVKVNDTVCKNNTSYDTIKKYRGTFDMFEYKLNSDGEISYIVFPQADGEKNDRRLSKIGSFEGAEYYKSETRSFSGKLLADANAKVFLVPLDRSRADAYALTDVSYFRNDVQYWFLVGYSYGDNDETAEYIVSEFNDEPTYLLKDICVIKNITGVLKEDGESARLVSVLYNGAEEREVVVGEDCSLDGAAPGDLVQYSTDLKGEMFELSRVFDRANKHIYHYGGGDYTSSCRILYGGVKEIKKSSFIFERADGTEEIITLGCPIVIYDSEARGEKLKVGSVLDIRDEKSYGANADKAVVHFEYGVPREIIIYR